MSLYEKLLERTREGRPINVAVVGAGQMGRGLVAEMERLPWFHVVAVADVQKQRAIDAFLSSGVKEYEIETIDEVNPNGAVITGVKRFVATNAVYLTRIEDVEVIVDATGVPKAGAEIAYAAIYNKKHVVMLNVEADVTVGRILKKFADLNGVVYTASAGDEYAAAKELVDFARAIGFEVVAAGKGKNNPLDRRATPKDLEQRAKEIGANPWMLSSFVDGSKTAVEMTCLANATGLKPDIIGMHGPSAAVSDLPKIFKPKTEGGILNNKGIVDYVIGIAPGVFTIVTTDIEEIARDMEYLGMGKRPYWVLYRPFHLANLETPLSVGRAVIYKEPSIAPGEKPVAEAVAFAKRDIVPGEVLDPIGGYCYYGMIAPAEQAKKEGFLPLGLAEGAKVLKRIKQDEPIRYDDVQLEQSTLLYKLRTLQDIDADARDLARGDFWPL